jgi:hypothetical protein
MKKVSSAQSQSCLIDTGKSPETAILYYNILQYLSLSQKGVEYAKEGVLVNTPPFMETIEVWWWWWWR